MESKRADGKKHVSIFARNEMAKWKAKLQIEWSEINEKEEYVFM